MEVSFENVSLSSGRKQLLNNISFIARKGEITTFLGDSTSPIDFIFDLIMKNKKAFQGAIYLDGENIKRANYKIAYMNGLINDKFFVNTVQEVFAISLKRAGKDDFDHQEKIRMLQKILLDESYLYRDIASLSKGERKKISIGAILLEEPDLILLRDPFLLFTNREKKDFIQLLMGLRKNGKTILFGTSDTSAALALSDFVYITAKNKVLEGGISEYILSDRKCLAKARLQMPPILDFIDTVKQEKNIKMLYRTEMNDLIKDIYRYVS